MTDSRVLELNIGGMTCASCVRRVEKRLSAVEGVEASVNLPLHSATVTAPESVDTQELIAAVERAGYSASLASAESAPEHDDAGSRRLVPRLVVAAVLTLPVVLLSMVPALAFPGSAWVVAALSTPVATWAAWPFHKAAAVNARHGGATMDTLVSLGVAAAWISSLVGLVLHGDASASSGHGAGHGGPALYFESAAVIVTFLLLGRILEARATRSASAALAALRDASPRTALLLEREGMPLPEPAPVASASLRTGDLVQVRPGDLVPADGTVESGTLSLDTSSMTGESVPRSARPGDEAHAGAVVLDGSARLRAQAVGAETRLARMSRLVADAQTKKARIARLADRVSGVFVPVVVVLAVLTFAAWWVVTGSPAEALGPAVAVLVIACPCALGLATPVGLVAGSGRGAELGIFISGPQALERASGLKAVVFDKTGTLTTGRMSVSSTWGDPEALRLAAALERESTHPIAQAIAAWTPGPAPQQDAAALAVEDMALLADGGVRGCVEGREVLAGSPRALRSAGIDVPEGAFADAGLTGGETLAAVAVDGRLAALFAVSDAPREDAAETVAQLTRDGLAVYMLTGDHAGAARSVANAVGIEEGRVRAGLLPEDKVREIERIRAEHGSVVMVGDGLNDAAALATADLGISLTTGTDAAQGAADMTILADRLGTVVTALALARRTLRTIRTNLGWAFAYNVIGIPIAALGLLSPMFAGMAMAASSVLVVANSLRLRRWEGR
ncbi:cation-translocating P-type ATPase [Falsarthrobacter nasiphocae]|uniref:Cu+-exporting ATPase n=1 Tax=Falsarthrobacter nasiphocae TaxID=189863 RepID=A0AAE3YH71_9MICC|nr:cation-translocating P-type ATPase [Falsarthrobacter nasiphocae]MDR6892144.1 Cu+-exporting ATPase [Falsarthrobacter nasiphocae]